MFASNAMASCICKLGAIRRLSRTFLVVMFVVSFVCMWSAGCARQAQTRVYPVHGQVLLNGKPLADAIVSFHLQSDSPEAVFPSAHTDAEGRFVLTSFEEGDGAPEGTYAISLVCFRSRSTRGGGGRANNVLPQHYASPASSGLSAKIVAGDNELAPLNLKSR